MGRFGSSQLMLHPQPCSYSFLVAQPSSAHTVCHRNGNVWGGRTGGVQTQTGVWENQTPQLTRTWAPPTAGTVQPLLAPARLDPAQPPVPAAALSPSENNFYFSFPNLSEPPWCSLPFQGMGCICSPAGLVACGQLFCLLLLYSCLGAINCLCSKVACPDDFTT